MNRQTVSKITTSTPPPPSGPFGRNLLPWMVIFITLITLLVSMFAIRWFQSHLLAAHENEQLLSSTTETDPIAVPRQLPASRDNAFKKEIESLSTSLLIAYATLVLVTASIILLLYFRYMRPIRHMRISLTTHEPDGLVGSSGRGTAREVRDLGTLVAGRLREYADANDLLRTERDELLGRTQSLAAELVRARDQVLIAAEQKTGFLGLVSHNLRMPLQSILLYTQAVMDRVSAKDDPIAMDDLQTVMRSGKHLLNLIDQILDFSRLESGRATVAQDQIAVDNFMNSVRNMITPLAQKNGNILFTNVDASVDEFTSDRDKLLQIALNLLGNSCKYTRQGRITFNVLCASNRLTMIVSDTGVGMTEEEVKNIFTAFFRAKDTSSAVSGTGLGLAITERLVRLLNGSIDVDSTIGKGTTMIVQIPLELRSLHRDVFH